jgi:bacterioferritin (cytochrome b1)
VEEQQRFLVRRLKEDNHKIVEEHKIREHEIRMEYEDLRSYFVRRHDYVCELIETIARHEETIKNLEETRDRLSS